MNEVFDIVSVFHNDCNTAQFGELEEALGQHLSVPYRLIGVDNRSENRGFSVACNLGASRGVAPIVAFINPDAQVLGDFGPAVLAAFDDEKVKVTGERFGKPADALRFWGVTDWVCGAVFFVRRDWWEHLGGFDTQFWMYFEETDFCRRTEAAGGRVRSIPLPVRHESPAIDTPTDAIVKRRAFEASADAYFKKWSHAQQLPVLGDPRNERGHRSGPPPRR